MNKNQLKQILVRDGFRPDSYSFEDAHAIEAYCLSFGQGRWFVYYSERGLQHGKKEFETEKEACRYFLELIRSDQSTGKR